MTNEELELRIRFLIGNYRNLVYYCGLDTSERSTYIHQVRKFRKKAQDLIDIIPPGMYQNQKELFERIIQSCPVKIKTQDCKSWIMGTLSSLLLDYYGKEH